MSYRAGRTARPLTKKGNFADYRRRRPGYVNVSIFTLARARFQRRESRRVATLALSSERVPGQRYLPARADIAAGKTKG